MKRVLFVGIGKEFPEGAFRFLHHALKQFTYLFPGYTELPTEFVYVKEDNTA